MRLLLALLCMGCSAPSASSSLASPSVQPEPESSDARGIEAVAPKPSVPAVTFDLELPGQSPARVYVPEGPGPFSVVVVAHGAGGLAESHVAFYRQLFSRPFIIAAPRGTPLRRGSPEDGYYYPDHLRLETEVMTLVQVLREAERPELVGRTRNERWIYAGYSQGATMGALMLVSHGDVFDRLIFVEGGTEGWTYARSQEFFAAGGRRILWVCGTKGCSTDASRASDVAQSVGVQTQVLSAPGAGHTYGGEVAELLFSAVDWLDSGKQ